MIVSFKTSCGAYYKYIVCDKYHYTIRIQLFILGFCFNVAVFKGRGIRKYDGDRTQH